MDANIVTSQFTAAAVFVWGMEKLKSLSWIQHNGQVWLKRGASILAALLVHTGISYVWNPNSTGGHQLILSIPAWTVVAVGLWHWLGQYAMQEVMYQAAVNKPAITTSAVGAIPAMVAPGGAVVVPAEPKP